MQINRTSLLIMGCVLVMCAVCFVGGARAATKGSLPWLIDTCSSAR